MAIKKNFLDDYLKEREDTNLTSLLDKTKYSHNRVFDEPNYLKEENDFIESITNKSLENIIVTNKQVNVSQDEVKTNLELMQDNATTNIRQMELSRNISQDEVETKPKTLRMTKSGQNQHKKVSLDNYSSLIGLQRRIVLFIYDYCKIARDSVTNPIAIEFLSEQCGTTKRSAQKTIQRLEQKEIVIRKEYKDGRGGWTKYELSEQTFKEILHEESRLNFTANLGQTYHEVRAKPKTDLKTSHSSSSSLNKTTTINEPTETASSTELPADWQAIDFSSLASIGFNTNKLQQIYQAGILTSEMVQDSIHAFVFDRDVNNKQYNNPIGFIMSLLKVKGMPYEFPQNYESPRDAALRKYVEQKQAQRERTKQLQDLLKQDAFESWLMTLSADETEKLIPHEVRKNESLRRGALLNHFQTHIWPEEEKKLTDRAGT